MISKKIIQTLMEFNFIFDKSITRLPLSVIKICNFIGALFDKSYSPSTITSHVSAISYIHKILGIFDPTSAFVVTKLLKGCNNLRKSHDTRLPITKQKFEKQFFYWSLTHICA
jgi:hypothetical protein